MWNGLSAFIRKHPVPLIIAVGFFVFGPTLPGGFLWDDHEMIVRNPLIQDVNGFTIKQAFTSDVFNGKGNAYYRPLQTLSNMVDYRIWGLKPFGFHFTNLLFHLSGAVLLFFLLGRVLKNRSWALGASVLFVVHPIVVEQLLIIAGRAEVMSMAFGLAFLLCTVQGSVGMSILGAVFLGLACLGKESGVVFFLFLPLLVWVGSKPRLSWRQYLPSAVIVLAYLPLRFSIMPLEKPGFPVDNLLLAFVRDIPVILVDYIRILMFPVDLHSHRRFVFSPLHAAINYAVLALVVMLLIRRRKKFEIFCGLWFFAGFLPKLGLLTTNSLMLDHWAYSGLIPLSLLLAKALVGLASQGGLKRRLAWGLSGAVIVFWGGLSWANIANRNTDEKIYRWALKYPTSSIVRSNLGQLCYLRGNWPEAEQLFQQSLSMNADQPMTINGLALVKWKQGDKAGALQLLNDLIRRKPDHLQSYVNRATIVRGSEGMRDLQFVLDKNPNYENAWLLTGRILAESGKFESAVLAYREVLRINSRHVEALTDLGTIFALNGRFGEAGEYWRKALRFDPRNEIASKNLIWLEKKLAAAKP